MSKILIVTNQSYMLWRFRKEVVEKILERNKVVLVTPFVGHEDDFEKIGCKCICVDVDRRGINPITDIKLINRYRKLINQEKPDLVITYSIKPNIYMGAICRWKKVSYCVNVQGLGTAFQSKKLASIVTVMYRWALKKAKNVFFENKKNAEEFLNRKIIPYEKIVVLHGAGINLKEYKYSPYPKRNIVRFLYLGRIMKEKGMDEFFEVVQKIKKEYGDKVEFHIVGFFEDSYKKIVKQLEKEGIILFHGFQKETRPFYKNADCIVLPSYHEGMSNVLLEAAATGRVIITSDVPGCKEAVIDGETGWLCAVKDTQQLYEKIKIVMDTSREELESMGAKGRKLIEEQFDRESIVNETIKYLGLTER